MANEKAIWDSFRYGDESSFKSIFDAYYEALFNYGHKFSPDDHLVEDAIQELFVKLWSNRERIKETPSVKNYLYKAFRRTLVRKLDYAPKVMAYPDAEEKWSFPIELGHDYTLIRTERLKEIQDGLTKALSQMTPKQREIIHLRYYEGLEYEKIAEIMHLSAKSTYKLLYRSLDSLRMYLSNFNLLVIFLILYRLRMLR